MIQEADSRIVLTVENAHVPECGSRLTFGIMPPMTAMWVLRQSLRRTMGGDH